MVATDLDGTIVRSDGSISERTVKVLHGLVAAGIQVVFATGRPPRWMGPIVTDTGLRGLCICSNGGHFYDTATREIVREYSLDPEVAAVLTTELRVTFPGITFAVEFGHIFAHEAAFAPGWDPPKGALIGPVEELVSQPVVKLLARCSEPNPDSFLNQSRELVADRATVTRSIGVGLIEISRLGVTKGSALATLAEERGIEASEVIAFGDETNDVSMLKWAGRSVAVANAHQNAKDAAEEITASVENDGVAKILEELL